MYIYILAIYYICYIIFYIYIIFIYIFDGAYGPRGI